MNTATGAAAMAVLADSSQVSVLMVDDHAPNLLALEAILAPLNHRLVRAASGQEAFRHLLEEDFAVILMDVMMPGIDGYETASIIRDRARTRHVPIIFLTALSNDSEHVLRGYEYGAVDYLVKPFDPQILRSKVSVFVELHQQRQQIERQAARLRAAEIEALAQKSDRRYRRLMHTMPLSVFCMHPDGELSYANEIWLKLTGVASGAPSFWSAIHPDDRIALGAAWKVAMREGAAFEGELRILRGDEQTPIWHLMRIVPETDEHGVLVGWIATATDIDAQRAQRSRLNDLAVQLQASVQARDEFLSTAGHELRTPLTSLQLTIQGLLRRCKRDATMLASELVPKLTLSDQLVRRQGKLIEHLLDVSRIIEGRLRLELEPMDLEAVVREVIDRCEDELAAASCTLRYDCAGPVVGTWDRLRVEQVVLNLLTNAMKYGRGQPIEVAVGQEGDRAFVRVTDHGIGIAQADHRRIFDRFWRAAAEREAGGLGLGLWISRQIVESLGGALRLESDAGKGSAFTVDLPLVASAETT